MSFHHYDLDFCENVSNISNLTFDYYSLNYSQSCPIDKQIKNFISFWKQNDPKPHGILFSTPCNINITAKFNISQK